MVQRADEVEAEVDGDSDTVLDERRTNPEPLGERTPASDAGFEEAVRRETVRAKLFGRKPDTRIGRYRVVDTLGEGGMGVVFTAIDEDLDRKIALKVLRASSGSALEGRLQREARAMAKLSHPNVVTVHEVSVVTGRVCVAMEFVVGTTLREWLTEGRELHEICDVFAQTARGLIAAHEVGIVHRDLKPDNVMVGADGRVRVLDFGLAKTVGELQNDEAAEAGNGKNGAGDDDVDARTGPDLERLTVTGAVMGTPRYMAPEQFLAEDCDPRTDQFAFCVALYEAVYDQRAFLGKTARAIGAAVIAGDVEEPPDDHAVPERLALAIRRGLNVDANERHPSMSALLDVLSAIARARSETSVDGLAEAPPRGRRRVAFWGGLVALTGVSVGAVAYTSAPSANTAPLRDESPLEAAPEESSVAERLFLSGRQLYQAGDYSGAADEWARLLDQVPEATENRATRQNVFLNAMQGFLDAYRREPNLDGTRNAAFLEHGQRLVVQYLEQYRRAYGEREPLDAAVTEKIDELERLRTATVQEAGADSEDGASEPPTNAAPPEPAPKERPRPKKRRPRSRPTTKAVDNEPAGSEPTRPKQETDLEAIGR